MTATIHPFRTVNADSIAQTALAALGRIEASDAAHKAAIAAAEAVGAMTARFEMETTIRKSLATIRTPDASAADVEAAKKAITALFAGLTAQERRQLGGIL